jgi:aldose 1-epimerase
MASEAKRTVFGVLADGTGVEAVELSNANGMTARIITLDAILQSLTTRDRHGTSADIVLGFSTAAEYLATPHYIGAAVGRYANRIAGGKFALDGKQYTLETNDDPNHLHGGSHGFDKAVWTIESVASGSPARVVLSYVSKDGDGGYPGTLQVTATYSLSDENELTMEYRARTDQPTILNLTNHSFYNLAGESGTHDILAHRLTIAADSYTPVDHTLIPTGERRSVAGTPFDFRSGQVIGSRIRDGHDAQLVFGRGYDHNFVVNGTPGTLRMAARVEDPGSGRIMELLVNAPGLQFYSGNCLDGTTIGKSGRSYRQRDGLCLEAQVFPDSPNHPDFPTARLDPDQTYLNTQVLRFKTT